METPDLPTADPATLAGLKTWLGINDTDSDARMTPLVAAVNVVVRGLPVADTAAGATEWPAPIVTGATMLAARLWARKDSPEGVAQFASDGPVYVQRNDPDVALLLQLGPWAKPAVG